MILILISFIFPFVPSCVLLRPFTAAHLYNAAGAYAISIECQTSKSHWAVDRSNIILQPINQIDGLRCFSPRQLDTILNCAVRYGDTLWIQTKNDTGIVHLSLMSALQI